MDLSKTLAIAAACVALLACGGSKPPVAAPAAQATATPGPPAQGMTQSPSASNVSISEEIRSKCGLPDADAYFAFDSAHLTTHDHSPLDLVAKCFTRTHPTTH